jgi:NFACT protein RNA binding domain
MLTYFYILCYLLRLLFGLARNLTSVSLQLSSAHVYLRMPAEMSWEAIPQAILTDCAQLVKANSIEGGQTYGACCKRDLNDG